MNKRLLAPEGSAYHSFVRSSSQKTGRQKGRRRKESHLRPIMKYFGVRLISCGLGKHSLYLVQIDAVVEEKEHADRRTDTHDETVLYLQCCPWK